MRNSINRGSSLLYYILIILMFGLVLSFCTGCFQKDKDFTTEFHFVYAADTSVHIVYKIDFEVINDTEVSVKKFTASDMTTYWYLHLDDCEINIPSTVKNGDKIYNVTAISEKAFDSCALASTIYIPSSIKQIESYAFNNVEKMRSVIFLGTVETINEYAFNCCLDLISPICIDAKEIKSYAFNGCKISEAILSDRVLYVYPNVFSNCDLLESIYISKSVKKIYCEDDIDGNTSNKHLEPFMDGDSEEYALSILIVDKDNPNYYSKDNNSIYDAITNEIVCWINE